ncbi:MAG: metallophosphoesterase [Balneolales bacterium]
MNKPATRPKIRSLKAAVYLIAIGCLISQSALAQKFTIPVLPDTQTSVNYNLPMFTSQMQWIADTKDSLNYPIALHVGDLVDFDNHDQYIRASEGYKILDRVGLPYAITLGNHDTEAVGEFSGSAAPGNVNENLRKTTKFNNYFPVDRFTAQKDRFEEHKSDNATYEFEAGGLNWLVVTLEFCARHEPVEWANEIIPKYPNHNVIVLTHYHLSGRGTIGGNNAGYGDLSPREIYDRITEKNANILMFLSGHISSGSSWRTDTGAQGNDIYQILQNYQREDNGGGYIRLLEIDTAAGTIDAKMYSPFYKQTKEDASRFSFDEVTFIKGE